MRSVILQPLRYPVTLVVSLVFALLVLVPASTGLWAEGLKAFDRAYPVVEMSGTLLRATDNEVVVSIAGRKLRDCQYLRITAYAVGSDGVMRDAYIERVDHPEKGETKPIGAYDIGAWRVWPTHGAAAVRVYVHHVCGSRLVTTLIADVSAGR